MARSPAQDDTSLTFAQRFTMVICRYNFIILIAFVLESMLWTLTILSILFGDLDRGTRVVVLLNVGILTIVTIPTLGGLYLCMYRT